MLTNSTKNHQFELISSTEVKEINGTAHIYQHKILGTKLLYLQNEDDNKVFTAAFETPPSDHTGVAHIVEHCVLSGSRKYHTKEPFMDLIKGSLQTFLNAMTFSDKTIYPVASRNNKDFSQLVDVYLDSVFFPKIYDDKSIFMQEGWHYHINDKDDALAFNGVVYNEMKGSYSDPFSELSDCIDEALFPSTCYAFSSGGRPENIPDLTYENFLNFHKEHYHPADAKLLFYGDLDIELFLNHIENDYLVHFDKKDKNMDLQHSTIQPSIDKPVQKTCYYPASAEENTENKYWLSQNFVFGEKTDAKLSLSIEILKRILISSTAAPLKKALIDKAIGEDIIGYITDTRQIGFSIIAKNTSLNNNQLFLDTIDETLREIVKNGLNKDLVQGSIQIYEYRLREGSQFPIKGLMHHINVLENWLYDEDPLAPLQYEHLLEEIKKDSKNGYFENLIQQYMIGNNHSASVILEPKTDLNEIRENNEKSRLTEAKISFNDEQIDELIAQTQNLIKKQQTPDKPEDIATIPTLSRDDLDQNIKIIPQDVQKMDDFTFLYHDIFTSGISYVDFLFDINHINKEDMPYISLLCSLLGKLNTTRNFEDFSNELSLHTGTLSITPQTYSPIDHDEEFKIKLVMHTKYLENAHLKPLELLKEMITQTDFSDVKRIENLVKKQKSSFESALIYNGNEYAARRSLSYISSESNISESLYGIKYYQTLCHLIAENKFEMLSEKLIALKNLVFTNNNLHIAFTGDKAHGEEFIKDINIITDCLYKKELIDSDTDTNSNINADFKPAPTIEALSSTSMVQFVAQTSNYNKIGYQYAGNMKLVSSYLNAEFLHNKVRAQGGAYGCGIQIGISGNLSITSYRDPKMFETIDVYSQIADHLENLEITASELEPFIISTFGKTDPSLTPRTKSILAISRYFIGITKEDLQNQRDSILSATPETIKSYSEFFRKLLSTKNICIFGNDAKIKEKKDNFNIITTIDI